MLNERSILTIEGKVMQKVLKKLTHDFSLNENQLWFFVGNKLPNVPKGWKTICKFEAHPNIPTSLKKLPALVEWDYNPNAISLAHSKDVELGVPDNIINDLYQIVFIQLKNSFDQKPKQPLYKKDLVDFLKKSFKTHSTSANQILDALMQLGKVTQKNDNEVELADLEE